MVGRGASNDRKGRNCTTASYTFSIIGIITGIVLIVVLSITLTHNNYCNPSCYYGFYNQDGCIKCCEYRSCSDGSYRDSNGCTQCCEYKSCHYGSYLATWIPGDVSSVVPTAGRVHMVPISIPLDAFTVAFFQPRVRLRMTEWDQITFNVASRGDITCIFKSDETWALKTSSMSIS